MALLRYTLHFTRHTSLVVLRQIHPRIQRRDFLLVAVEHQRGYARVEETAADPAFASLAPARVVDIRVHVRVEAVLVRGGEIPRCRRLPLRKADLDDRLDSFEAVFPGHDEAQRCAVLIEQRLAVQADGEQRQRMHRFIDAKTFDVGPREHARALPRHFIRTQHGLERDVLRLGGGFEAFQYGAERYAYPRNHHRPCFDAAHAVDPLFERVRLEQVFEREGPGYFRFARDADRPRHALESTRVR